jgi:ATP-dependent exoDNAse (exonuclease V) beta subunit
VHAVLAAVPLDASPAAIGELATLHARLLGATDAERAAAATAADRVLKHPLMAAAREAARAGRRVVREAPASLAIDGVLVDGQVDLAFEDASGEWVVVDFKTDAEIGASAAVYQRQVAIYVAAVTRATERPARGVLLRV